MIPYWPLDPSLLLPVARSLPARTLVSPFEDGPPAVRRRFLGAPGMMSGTIRMTGAEFGQFMAFGEGTLTDWSLPFRWTDPVDGLERQMQFNGEPGLTLEASAGSGLDPDRTVWAARVSLWVTQP